MKSAVVLITAAVTLMLGCKTPVTGSATSPEETEWTLTNLDGQPVALTAGRGAPTLKFDATTGRVSGLSGVNRYAGTYELQGTHLKFGPLTGTRMAGPPEAMALESTFLATMQKVSAWKNVLGDTLELGTEKATLMTFKKSERK